VQWIFVGQNELGASALESLTQRAGHPSTVITRTPKETHPNRVEAVAHALGIPVVHASQHRLDEFSPALDASDLMVCCGWARRIPERHILAPRYGSINLHPGDLPTWGGSNPLGWQRVAGRSQIAYSVHRMTAVIDHGELLGSGFVDADRLDTGFDLRRKAGRALGMLAGEVILAGVRPVARSTPADASQATPPRGVLPAITPNDMSCADVDRIVRAFSPHPGVVSRHEDSWIGVRSWSGLPGTTSRVLRCRDGELTVELLASGSAR
jgi:methionyl-tRNA formyltransferase